MPKLEQQIFNGDQAISQIGPEEVRFELDCFVLGDLALLVPDLGGDALGQRHHRLGHVDQHIEVLEGLRDVGLVCLVLLGHVLLDSCDSCPHLLLHRNL